MGGIDLGDIGKVGAALGTGGMSMAATGVPGMSGKSSGAPTAPDFKAAAEAAAASAHPNQTNAFGATSGWTRGPGGQWTQNASLGGPLGSAVSGLAGQAATNAGTPLDNGTAVRQQAIDASYGQAASRLDPRFAQAEESQNAQLVNQGLDPGSEAYDRAAGNLSREKNDAYSSAMNTAVQTGNQAQALTFGENLAARDAPLQQLGQLAGLTGQSQAPGPTSFLPAAMAQSGADLQKYGIDQAGKNSMMSGAAGMAPMLGGKGAGAGASSMIPLAATAAI